MRGVAKRLVGGGTGAARKQATPELARNARYQKKIPKIETETNIKSKKNEKKRKCASWKNIGEFSLEMGFTSFCILNLENADKLVWSEAAEEEQWRQD